MLVEEDSNIQNFRFNRADLDGMRLTTKTDLMDDCSSSMALTEIKQTPIFNKAADLESSLSMRETSEVKDKKKRNHARDPKEPPLVINAIYTQYDVMKDVADEMNFVLSYEEEEDWDIYWIDGPIAPTFLLKMQAY